MKFSEILENFLPKVVEIASETCTKVKRKRKRAKFSACGEPKSQKKQQNIDLKFDLGKISHAPKTNKKTLFKTMQDFAQVV